MGSSPGEPREAERSRAPRRLAPGTEYRVSGTWDLGPTLTTIVIAFSDSYDFQICFSDLSSDFLWIYRPMISGGDAPGDHGPIDLVVIITWVQYLGPPRPSDSRDLLEVLRGLPWQREREPREDPLGSGRIP